VVEAGAVEALGARTVADAPAALRPRAAGATLRST
jgi:hypothetical protein